MSAKVESTEALYYRARYYDPQTGRFLSEDPTGFRAGPNFYEYAANSPLDFEDPTGLDNRSEYCKRLAEKIENIKDDIQKRIGELDENWKNLPETCPGDKDKPSLSRRGHRRLINELKKILAQREVEYLIFCTDPPTPPLVPAPELQPSQKTMPLPGETSLVTGIVIGILGFLALLAGSGSAP